jgi:hypothetical protein
VKKNWENTWNIMDIINLERKIKCILSETQNTPVVEMLDVSTHET